MPSVEKILNKMAESPTNIRYDELHKVCCEHSGAARQKGTGHAVFKTPWAGDPRVNIQRGDGGKAETYQVEQVLAAIERLEQTQ